jgi:hypothetical protein
MDPSGLKCDVIVRTPISATEDMIPFTSKTIPVGRG